MKKRVSLLLTVLVALAWLLLFRPVVLGGPASYVVVSGVSMQPTMYTGDLAIVHRQNEYHVGDVIAFRTPEGAQVIHRIVGGNGKDGFVPQGDNRDRPDDWRPTQEDILGSLWLHAPGFGDHLLRLRQPQQVGMLMAALVMLGGVGAHEQKRRGGKRVSPQKQQGTASATGGLLQAVPPTLLVGIAAAALLTFASVALTYTAFRSAAERTEFVESARYEQTGEFDYAVGVTPSTLYPSGVLQPLPGETEGEAAPPQPIYTRLAQDMTVTFDYSFNSSAANEITGTLRADMLILAGEGWSRAISLLEPTPFTGESTSSSFTVNFAEIEALVTAIEEETGFTPGTYTLRVTPSVAVSTDIAGQPVETVFAPPFEVKYDQTQITPPSTLLITEPARLGRDTTFANELGVLGVTLPVATWRWMGATGAVLALAATGLLACVAFLGVGREEEARIQTRYRSMLVPVESNGSHAFDRSIHVYSMQHLARLAQRDGGIIFHEAGPYLHRYFVRDGEDTYDYTIRSNDAGQFSPFVTTADDLTHGTHGALGSAAGEQ